MAKKVRRKVVKVVGSKEFLDEIGRNGRVIVHQRDWINYWHRVGESQGAEIKRLEGLVQSTREDLRVMTELREKSEAAEHVATEQAGKYLQKISELERLLDIVLIPLAIMLPPLKLRRLLNQLALELYFPNASFGTVTIALSRVYRYVWNFVMMDKPEEAGNPDVQLPLLQRTLKIFWEHVGTSDTSDSQ